MGHIFTAHAQKRLFNKLPVKNLNSPFASTTQISCIRWISLRS